MPGRKKAATLQLGGLPVSRKKFRAGWITAQIKELRHELRHDLPKDRRSMSDIEWRSIQECKALVKQQISLMEAWLAIEKKPRGDVLRQINEDLHEVAHQAMSDGLTPFMADDEPAPRDDVDWTEPPYFYTQESDE